MTTVTREHMLKIHPTPMEDLLSGAKTGEVRRDDRDFSVGDTVHLIECSPEDSEPTGRELSRVISHIQRGYGLPDWLCVLSYAQASAAPEQAKMCDCNQGRLPCSCKQASAAPEQEPVYQVNDGVYGWIDVDSTRYTACTLDPENYLCRVLYSHAEPSEMAQLRAWKFCPECGCEAIHHQEGNHKQCANCYQEWFSDMDYTDVVRTHLAGKFRDKDAVIEAAAQRADAAERKLGSVTEYVQGMVNAAGNQQSVATGYLRDILDALLSASAEPASPWIKCSDRLPDYNQNVMVCFGTVLGTQQITTAQLNHQKRCADPASTTYDDIWYVTVSFGHKIRPTHWMPLPDAPAKGGDGEVQS